MDTPSKCQTAVALFELNEIERMNYFLVSCDFSTDTLSLQSWLKQSLRRKKAGSWLEKLGRLSPIL